MLDAAPVSIDAKSKLNSHIGYPSKNHHSERTHEWCVRCGEILEAKWRDSGEKVERSAANISKVYPDLRQSKKASDRESPVRHQMFSSFTPVKISPKRALRQRASQGGVIGRKILVTGCVTPPWNDLKLSDP